MVYLGLRVWFILGFYGLRHPVLEIFEFKEWSVSQWFSLNSSTVFWVFYLLQEGKNMKTLQRVFHVILTKWSWSHLYISVTGYHKVIIVFYSEHRVTVYGMDGLTGRYFIGVILLPQRGPSRKTLKCAGVG